MEEVKILIGSCEQRVHQVVRKEILRKGKLVQVMEIAVRGVVGVVAQKHMRQLSRSMQLEEVIPLEC